jgi:TPR repeat protein
VVSGGDGPGIRPRLLQPRHPVSPRTWGQTAQGHTGAGIKLGYMDAEGLGTQKDSEAAYFWIVSAALAGDNRGRELLAKLETVLSPQQIAEARQRAKICRPTACSNSLRARSHNRSRFRANPVKPKNQGAGGWNGCALS